MTGPIRFRKYVADTIAIVAASDSNLDTILTTAKGGSVGVSDKTARVTIQNIDASTNVTIRGGGTTAVSGTGFILQPYEVVIFEWEPVDLKNIQLISASGNVNIMVWEEGL